MSYNDLKQEYGKEPVYIVELDMDTCPLTWGTGLCTATGAAGTECFNTYNTCQISPKFAGQNTSTATHYFSSTRISNGSNIYHPTILSVQTAPTILTPGKGFGVRSTCSITIQDHPWTDIDTDPYVNNRTYDPDSQGTYWGKFIVRNRFYENRKITVRTGYLDENGEYDINNFTSRAYFIDSISGPSKDGKVTIKGKDILKFADSKKAQWPTQSEAVLDADITDSDTSFDINDPNDDVYAAYADFENGSVYRAYVRIDDEIMLVTNAVIGAGDITTLTVTRASMPSRYAASTNVADSHSEGATVQYCYEFDDWTINDIVEKLLRAGAGIDVSFLPLSDWQEVINFGLTSYVFSALITEPVGVRELIKELTEHSIYIWWNERDQEVQMRSIIQQAVDSGPYDDDSHLVADSVSVIKDDKERASQVWLIYGHRNPTLDMDKFNHFDAVKISADLDSESDNAYGQKRVTKIWSRWLATDQTAIASEITNRLNGEYKNTKDVISFTMTAKDNDAWTGDVVTLATRQLQDQFGATPTGTYRVLEATEVLKPGAVAYKYKVATLGNPTTAGTNTGLIGPNTLNDYDVESDANKNTYAFIAADDRGDGSPGFAPSDPPYFIV